MGWLVLNEYEGAFMPSPDGLFATIDTEKSRLVEQRLELFIGSVQARAFTARTNLIHLQTDCDVWIEIQPASDVDMDMEAGEQRWVRVHPGAQLTATEVFLTESSVGDICE